MTDVTQLRLGNSRASVTVSFASASSPKNLMTTNNIAFNPYPNYQQWREVFSQVWNVGIVLWNITSSCACGVTGSLGRSHLHAWRSDSERELQHRVVPAHQSHIHAHRLWSAVHVLLSGF